MSSTNRLMPDTRMPILPNLGLEGAMEPCIRTLYAPLHFGYGYEYHIHLGECANNPLTRSTLQYVTRKALNEHRMFEGERSPRSAYCYAALHRKLIR